ncbi:hypothetical protein CcaverHIS002_0501640 [Cutaneotrichosporon cavernicola]|uniref:Uncharacterized protein n=1 Tax=Cutaneotrichosporon cavernicola TaxID=279322 RepID=A0AA48QWP9_9TREE|nr:uncharacterized protein CcaverHIS019_0502230 [Cutaneotrichosporon cavernicola]BEI84763.1 hypothetical protein CcaverHIS002_0501640 [Cutaneotrichosporon cavernicola]BEI92595.1 hypothetical protein CcaverHIS019_0502230 [Cutaneotrichosporon cavernicola]BEJ00370.1 hypothetical protein CcaverHIS631_0502270 [Cutaneotrichosporon cavernicola]BEJ08140.1 hypothetical protein CcaverHIS641_0502250 [Cutaneotrichosporon cavernicola]
MSLGPQPLFSPRLGGDTRRHRTASPCVRLPHLQVRSSPAIPPRTESLPSTITGHVMSESEATVALSMPQPSAPLNTAPSAPSQTAGPFKTGPSKPEPSKSKYVRLYDASTFQEAFGKGNSNLGSGGKDKPTLLGGVRPPKCIPAISASITLGLTLDPRLRAAMSKLPDRATRMRDMQVRIRSFRKTGKKRALAGWKRAARLSGKMLKMQYRLRHLNKELRGYAAAEGITLEWGGAPSPVKVVKALPSAEVRLKLQLAVEKARADAADSALRILLPAIEDAGVVIPKAFTSTF